MSRLRGAIAALLVGLLAACGGGGGDEPVPETSAAATVGSAGGTVQSAQGATVVVPAGALDADVTIRVAKDSTGAPPLPAGLAAAGDVYAITPHGTSFLQPAEVRVPVPSVTLQPNQRLALMKAEPGGSWQLLPEAQQREGLLVAAVDQFSLFLPVILSFATPTPDPLKVNFEVSFDPVQASLPPVRATVRWSSTGRDLPSVCASGQVAISLRGNNRPIGLIGSLNPGAARSQVVAALPDGRGVFTLEAFALCVEGGPFLVARTFLFNFGERSVYAPGIRSLTPASDELQVVEGTRARVRHLFAGGAYREDGRGPGVNDRAIVQWERSDDAGQSWRPIARSLQNEGEEVGAAPFWAVAHEFAVGAADDNALIRSTGCYTEPGSAQTNCAEPVTTRLVVIRQAALPVIQTQPRPVLVRSGQSADFSVAAGGIPAPDLQWQSRAANGVGDWANVVGGTGATTSHYTTPVLGPADNGREYRVVATNAAGSATSVIVTASVSDVDVPPAVTAQPANTTVTAGSDATLAIAARGTEPVSYQWRRNGTPITGANSPILTLPAVGDANAGSYDVVVSNPAGSATSQAAVLTVQAGGASPVAPTIVTQPAAVTVNSGNSATFAVGVGGTGPYTYQWRFNGLPIAGATLACHHVAAAAAGDMGSYSVTVGNASGVSVTSAAAALTVLASPAPAAVGITTQPAPQAVPPGGTAVFAVAASGTGPLQYQWSKGGVDLPGQTGPVLQIASVSGADAGSYAVTVSNALGSVSSAAAALVVPGAPAITVQPVAANLAEGAAASFSVAATGTDLRYQWTRNGIAIAGATAAAYTTPALAVADSGAVYAVFVYNSAGAVLSNPAVITVTSPLAAWSAPATVGTGNNGEPAAGVDAARNTLALWASTSGGRDRLTAARGSIAGAWQSPVLIDAALPVEASSYSPQLAVASGGAATAVWGYGVIGTVEFHFAAARFSGNSWGAAERLDTEFSGQSSDYRVAMDDSGRAIAIWRQFNGTRRALYARIHDGSGWQAPAIIDGGRNTASVALAVDAQGRGWVAFADDPAVKVAAVDLAAGSIGAPVVIGGTGSSPRDLQAAIDAAGGAIVTWAESSPDGAMLMAARHAGGTWQGAVQIDLLNAGQPDHGVAITSSGAAIVAWAERDNSNVNAVFSRQFLNGSWQAAERRSPTGATGVSRVQVAAGGGRIIVNWVQNDPTSGNRSAWAQGFGSSWSTPVRVQGNGSVIGSVALPLDTRSIAVGPDGATLLLWTENAGNQNRPVVGAMLP